MHKETEDFDHEIIAYLSTRKQKLIESHSDYIQKHPEMREILNDFLSSVLLNKPDDVYLFSKEYFHPFNPTPVKDKPFIVCGPFGVGKKTLRKTVLDRYGDLFDYVISHTTRKQKPGEDADYHFVTKEKFDKMKKEGKFLETAESWGEMYGTSKDEIQRIRDEGKIPYIEVDFRGANGLKSIAANFVFLYPPSIEELRRRIANRTEDTEELFKERIKLAIKEIELANNTVLFTNRITNDNLEKAEKQLTTLIEALYFQELKDKRGEDYDPSALAAKLQSIKKETKEDIQDLREEIKEINAAHPENSMEKSNPDDIRAII
jgi:guanylate kinase